MQRTTSNTSALCKRSAEKLKLSSERDVNGKECVPYEVENDPSENCLVIERRVFGLILTGNLSSACQLSAGNVNTDLFFERQVKAGSG